MISDYWDVPVRYYVKEVSEWLIPVDRSLDCKRGLKMTDSKILGPTDRAFHERIVAVEGKFDRIDNKLGFIISVLQ